MPPAAAASSSSSSSSSAQPPPAPSSEQQQQQPAPEPQLLLDRALPAPGDTTTTLDVSGDGSTVKLDALGPLVVNQDGTLSRIANWAAMTPIERENTLRVLGKRNQLRLATLGRPQADEGRGNNADS